MWVERVVIMIDDYKYSVGRTVVYRHPNPERLRKDYGQFGPDKTVGVVNDVELGKAPDLVWVYVIENARTAEVTRVSEQDIHHATLGKDERKRRGRIDIERVAEAIAEPETESVLAGFLRTTVREFRRREETEELARREGRELPLKAGDYIRIRGDIRRELEPFHNHYAKILDVSEPDIAAIESRKGTYKARRRYTVRLDDDSELVIYDPEVKHYYTSNGRATVLNWRAAAFLAEAFGDDPPYKLEYSYLEDHVFSRDELEPLSIDGLTDLLTALLYVKGRMGLRDLEFTRVQGEEISREHLVDNVLAISRFDMRRNRTLTSGEIEGKRKEIHKLRRLLRGR